MIVVKADKKNDLYRKGETVTKLNNRVEKRLLNTVLHSLHHLKYKNGLVRSRYETNPTYIETVNLFGTLFGYSPSQYGH